MAGGAWWVEQRRRSRCIWHARSATAVYRVQKHIKQSTECLSRRSVQAQHASMLFIHCFRAGVGERGGD